MSIPRDPRRLCCHCLGVSFAVVDETVRTHRCRTVQEVTKLCRAGGGCRSCHPDILEVIQAVRRESKPHGIVGWLRGLFGGGNGA